jgi:hypothetical protein
MSNLIDDKQRRVFINNFFKTKYFKELNLNKYKFREYSYHQLCFILRFSPESLLYTIDKFNNMNGFEKNKLKKFLKIRFQESLNKQFNEEQLYYYFAIKEFEFNDLLPETKDMVLSSQNQILISYYLKDGVFSGNEINILKTNTNENSWFQNYHLILYTDLNKDIENNIKQYLIPEYARKPNQEGLYMNFYKSNLDSGNSLIRNIEDVNDEIQEYLRLKIEESQANFIGRDAE